MKTNQISRLVAASLVTGSLFSSLQLTGSPKAILISLDGGTGRFIEKYLTNGALPANQGIGLLRAKGIRAVQNITATPSLTAVGHVAIATGSTSPHNDIMANSFSLVASPISRTISGFGAPIGGYCVNCGPGGIPGMSPSPTAEPLWMALRAAGKSVVTATWAGGDGVDVTIPGLSPTNIVQPHSERTVDYTVPFGSSTSPFETAYSLTADQFSSAPSTVINQLTAAGAVSYSPILQTTAKLETLTVGGATNNIYAAALDTSNDGTVNYDTLVFFDSTTGIQPGPFTLPSTGPAYVKFSDQRSSDFYIEGSSLKASVSFFISKMAPDLSTVHIARYSATYIPRNAAVIGDVDDVNNNVGPWGHQPDYYFTERLLSQVANFSDQELEAIWADQLTRWTDYQTRLALHAIWHNPNADLVMVYFEQPDGSEHQFLLTDPRQATNPTDKTTIGANQDPAKVARYATYVQHAYQAANNAVQQIISAVGVDGSGVPNRDIFVVSDHGFDTFHTSVNLTAYLQSVGVDTSKLKVVTSGPACNIYVNLQNRENGGTVGNSSYVALVQQIRTALHGFIDTNSTYTLGAAYVPVFDTIYSRPFPKSLNSPDMGLTTSANVGQDTGDVFAMLTPGYNFDGTQSPAVRRMGDPASGTIVLSVPNFYGAHGYNPNYPNMSAVLYAAGPDIGHGEIPLIHNIDIAPTLEKLLGVTPAATVDGHAFSLLKP